MAAEAASPLRIAMWSGPRNISTAMMRSWGNRTDTAVIDEPLYAHYLKETGKPHPGADEIIEAHETDVSKIVELLTGPPPGGADICYQKHMAHHLLPGMPRAWVRELTNCFLIREPREMLTSLLKVTPDAGIADTGLPQQVEILRMIRGDSTGPPVVLDARDVLENPEAMLRALCERLGVPFTERMLSWPAGPRETDGVWGKHWYDAVNRSTSFARYRPKDEQVPAARQGLLRECESYYAVLHQQRLTV